MEEAIFELIKRNTKVIIPDFGAFIVKQRNPLQVVFNEFLRFNDGVLIEYISKKENISKEDARNKVNDRVKNILDELNRGNSVPIKNIGILTKEKTGKISLENFTDIQNNITKEKDVSSESIIEVDISQNIVESLNNMKDDSIIINQTANNKLKREEKQEEIKEVKHIEEQEIKENKELVTNRPPAEKYQPEPTRTIKYKEPYIDNNKETQKIADVKKKSGISFKKIAIWFLCIVLINLIVVLVIFYKEDISKFYKEKTSNLKETLGFVNDKATKEQTIDESVTEKEEKDLKEVAQQELNNENNQEKLSNSKVSSNISENTNKSLGEKYYIVAGCFRDSGNANAYAIMLRNKGFNAEIFGKIGELNAVCFASFTNKEEALEELKKIRESGYPEAWIFHY